MLSALLGLSRSELLLNRARPLAPEQEARLREWLERRLRREPLQHILGVAHFYGLELKVTPEVLVPRPETERLVELGLEVLHSVKAPKVLDVGTGSGAIALAIKHERPDAEVYATDISARAVDLAGENADRLGLDLRLADADLLEDAMVADLARQLDLLISNPPYLPQSDLETVSPEVRADPAEALYSGPEGLEHFRRLERQAFTLLRPGAAFLVELDPRNVDLAFEFSAAWSLRRVETDLAGRRRFLNLRR